jgi:allantoinase
MRLSPQERVPYSALPDRPTLHLPDGARMVVWTIVNAENWDPAQPMPRTVLPPPMGATRIPDVPNWAWHEYGMRVGFWRFLDVLKNFRVRATFAVNGSVCERYPQIAEAALRAEWEFMGHGYVQQPMHAVVDERLAISQTIEAIRTFTGRAPRGWESPGLAETEATVDFLAEAGLEYVADWVLDDQPCRILTTHGPIVSLPYTVELNDVVICALQQQSSDELLKRGIRQFDRLYRESGTSPRVMAISIHPYLTGVPHRIGYLEELFAHITAHPGVLMWTGEQILDWFREASPAAT